MSWLSIEDMLSISSYVSSIVLHVTCTYLINCGHGKLTQSVTSRCSHLQINRSLPVFGWRVGGRWEVLHTQNANCHLNKPSTSETPAEPYLGGTEVSGSGREGGQVGQLCKFSKHRTSVSEGQHRWEPWLDPRRCFLGVYNPDFILGQRNNLLPEEGRPRFSASLWKQALP